VIIQCRCGCGVEFAPRRPMQKYASSACRRKDGRQRYNETWGPKGKPKGDTVTVPVRRVVYEDEGAMMVTELKATLPVPTLGVWGL
jgi:hypothetical protein